MITINEKTIIEFTIRECIKVYGLNPSLEDLLIDNIINRALMYSSQTIPKTNETQLVKNNDSIVLFFLNRFINNIRNYKIESELNLDGGKGEYINSKQELNMHSYLSIKKITEDKLKSRMQVSDRIKASSTRKVFNHEIGHALQTSFEGKIGFNDTKFSALLNRLAAHYPDVFNAYHDLKQGNLIITKKGMDVVRKNDKYEKVRNFYAPNSYTTYLDEIFNEDEALKVTGITSSQFSYDMGNGIARDVYNYESSNYRITPYARMMKILLGEKRTFYSMYNDSIIAYDYFDNFLECADVAFASEKTHPPMYTILEKMHIIKTSKDLNQVASECIKLDLFFTKCLEEKINKALENSNLSNEQIHILMERVNDFSSNLLKSNSLLPAHQIINSINEKLEKKLIYKKENATEEDYLKILEDMYEARLIGDEDNYKIISQKEAIIRGQLFKGIPPLESDYSNLNKQGKVNVLIFKMKEALDNSLLDDYLYYQANLKNVQLNKSDESGLKV